MRGWFSRKWNNAENTLTKIMKLFNSMFGNKQVKPPAEIVLTASNIAAWPKFKKLLDDGKIVADKAGRLRYLHGAPVGKLILVRTAKDGTPHYAESANEWFDPGSKKAQEFVWP